MFRSIIIVLFVSFCFNNTTTTAQNLVPNPSFEQSGSFGDRWISTRSIFDTLMAEWTSPNEGSPDILFVESIKEKALRPPRRYVNLMPYRPHSGEVMVGIKTYGCETRMVHCREYIQAELKEPMIIGETYYAEFWVRPIKYSFFHNYLGMAFSTYKCDDKEPGVMHYQLPLILSEEILNEQRWIKISGSFVADEPYTHLLVGNFYTAQNITLDSITPPKMDHAYYLLDDILLRHEKRFQEIAVGTSLVLNNIFFETGEAILLSKSFLELDQLYAYLKENSSVRIQLSGHTDNIGDNDFNLQLSIDRAEVVADYLQSLGIEKERIEYRGLGASDPVADNDTEAGRQQNRRVELLVLSN
ncbi:MAG: OmpA family protein [Bacteroidota bacterium]